jgi:methionyl aminopeptidase
MILLKSAEEIELIKKSADILNRAHGEVAKLVGEGVTTLELDKVAEEFIKDHSALPSFKGYNGFPFSLCISVNENVVHGFPSGYRLKNGDVVSVDCGVYFNGYHSDCAFTYPIGDVSEDVRNLLKVTEESLYKGIDKFKIGNRVGDVSHAIQSYAESFNYTIVRELVGHGLGKNLHESPEVPNFGRRGTGAKITEGLVVAIEPMVNLGKRNIVQEADGWTIRTRDRMPSAHFEHTVAILNGNTEVLTSHQYIKENFRF